MSSPDWSGLVSVNSLPSEVRRRQAGNIRLVESALHTPNIPVGERRYGIPSGYPAVAESMPGGAFKVSVNSLAVKSAAMPIGNADEVVYDDAPTDAFGRAAYLNNTFREFFRDTVGRLPIREFGPKAGYLGGIGVDSDFPHRPGRSRMRTFKYGARPGFPTRHLPPSGEVRVHPDTSCDVAHPGIGHDDWVDQGEEEEQYRARLGETRRAIKIAEAREIRRHEWTLAEIEQRYHNGQLPHYGMMSRCSQVHPGQTHETWRRS